MQPSFTATHRDGPSRQGTWQEPGRGRKEHHSAGDQLPWSHTQHPKHKQLAPVIAAESCPRRAWCWCLSQCSQAQCHPPGSAFPVTSGLVPHGKKHKCTWHSQAQCQHQPQRSAGARQELNPQPQSRGAGTKAEPSVLGRDVLSILGHTSPQTTQQNSRAPMIGGAPEPVPTWAPAQPWSPEQHQPRRERRGADSPPGLHLPPAPVRCSRLRPARSRTGCSFDLLPRSQGTL